MTKKIFNNKYSITIYILLFNLILFLTKIILNFKGLEFMSWVYYLSALITLAVIIYISIKKISLSQYCRNDIVLYNRICIIYNYEYWS